MLNQTKIEWTDFTVNWWEGCQKVGPGCDNCYAEARDIRFTGGSHWGPGAPRRLVKTGPSKLSKINRDAEAFKATHGRLPRVFCSSLSDVFDNAVLAEWRTAFFTAMENAPNTQIQIVTKRIGNVAKMIPQSWAKGFWPRHVGLMITVVTQDEAERDIPKLLDLKARFGIPWVGLSMEPLIEPVSLPRVDFHCCLCGGTGVLGRWPRGKCHACEGKGTIPAISTHPKFGGPKTPMSFVDHVIVGGESGPHARQMDPDWARHLRDQCAEAGTAFFMKQMTGKASIPEDLMIRQFPKQLQAA